MKIRQIREVWFWAAVAVVLVGLWQTATVHANFGGNWTALFCTGDARPVPPSLAAGTYLFRGSTGYDGQWYRYIAHDPFVRGDMHAYLDAPLLRYRRILVSGLAYVLGAGRPHAIDGMYIVVILGFVFAGCYWCGVWAVRRTKHPAWGLLFLLVPGALISMDRMTVDIAAAALAAGAVVYWDASRFYGCYLCLAAGCLTRETGLLIVVGWVLALVAQKHWKMAAALATSVVPAILWAFYLHRMLPPITSERAIPRWLFHWDSGILGRLFDPITYGFPQALETLVRSIDTLALVGILVLFAVTGTLALYSRTYPPAIAAWMYLGLFAIVNLKGFWDNVYGYSRPFSPMIVLAAFGLPSKHRLWVALLVGTMLIDLRIFLQLGPQCIGIYRSWIQ